MIVGSLARFEGASVSSPSRLLSGEQVASMYTMRLLRHYPAHDYKSIGDRTADIDLSRITVVFGANGAGKTNLLEAIAWTFEDATSEWFTSPRPRSECMSTERPSRLRVGGS